MINNNEMVRSTRTWLLVTYNFLNLIRPKSSRVIINPRKISLLKRFLKKTSYKIIYIVVTNNPIKVINVIAAVCFI